MSFFVYILASRRNGTVYIGMTDNLARRVWEHQSGAIPGFTKSTASSYLFGTRRTTRGKARFGASAKLKRESAVRRERQIKKWNRAWKLRLIERVNRAWRDLTAELI
jgi:putative endonuclease